MTRAFVMILWTAKPAFLGNDYVKDFMDEWVTRCYVDIWEYRVCIKRSSTLIYWKIWIGYVQKSFAYTGYLSLAPLRTWLGQTWTLPCAVMSPRETRPPFPRLRVQWVKRERLGPRLRISDTRLTTLSLPVRLGRCFDELQHGSVKGCYRFSGLPVVHEIARMTVWQKLLPSSNKPHFQLRPSTQHLLWKWVLFAWKWKLMSISKAKHLTSFRYRGPGNSEMADYRSAKDDQVDCIIFDWKVVKIHVIAPNKKSLFPFILSWWMKWVHRLVKILSRLF